MALKFLIPVIQELLLPFPKVIFSGITLLCCCLSLFKTVPLCLVKSMHFIILGLTQKTPTQQISPHANLINPHNTAFIQ